MGGRRARLARRVCLSVTGIILLLGATMATGDMPYAPIILFLLDAALLALLLKLKTQLAAYLISLSVVQLILAVGGMAAWAIWVFTKRSWEASKGSSSSNGVLPRRRRAAQHQRHEAGGRLAAAAC